MWDLRSGGENRAVDESGRLQRPDITSRTVQLGDVGSAAAAASYAVDCLLENAEASLTGHGNHGGAERSVVFGAAVVVRRTQEGKKQGDDVKRR